jgi:hypothetical protein
VTSVDQSEALGTRLKGVVEVLAPGCGIMPNAGPPKPRRGMLAHWQTLRFEIHPLRNIFKGAMVALWEL